MNEYIEKPDMQYILHIKSDKKVEKRLIDYCIESVIDVFEDTGLTADVQPVKHGRWIIADDVEHFIAICSECGRTEDSRDIKDMPYCHCGARMDEAKTKKG